MDIQLAAEIGYQFLKMLLTFHHCYEAKLIAKNYFFFSIANSLTFLNENRRKNTILISITGSCIHLIFLRKKDSEISLSEGTASGKQCELT